MRLPAEDFIEAVLRAVDDIPSGAALSYGEVAESIGSRAPRAVGQVLARYGSTVPWWRVVRASGEPAPGHERAALEHYRAEGTPLRWSRDRSSYRVVLGA